MKPLSHGDAKTNLIVIQIAPRTCHMLTQYSSQKVRCIHLIPILPKYAGAKNLLPLWLQQLEIYGVAAS